MQREPDPPQEPAPVPGASVPQEGKEEEPDGTES
jgi:hypothetical protein